MDRFFTSASLRGIQNAAKVTTVTPLGMKIEFYEFFGVLRSWSPFPFFDGINRGFCQQRTATQHLSELHFSVGRNYGFYPDGSAHLHLVGEFWIHRDHFAHYLPRCFRLFLSKRKGW